MKLIKILWIIISVIFLFWIYFFFIHPLIFKPNIVEVPMLISYSEAEAINSLKENNLSYLITYVDGKDDKVINTKPKAGIRVYEGCQIELIIEKHINPNYPSFMGLLFDSNKSLIENFCNENGITYSIEYVDSDEYPNNTIIWQSKNNDEMVTLGDELILRVCRDSSYFKMPNLVGLDIDSAVKELNKYNFNITIIYYETPMLDNMVIAQEIDANYLLKKNLRHNLRLYVSRNINDLETINILDFCNILNELDYNYDIIYVDSIVEDKIISIFYDEEELKYLIYVSKWGSNGKRQSY